MLKKVDSKGTGSTTTTYRYSGERLESVKTDGITAEYDYNSAGSLTRIKNPGGQLTYKYDSLQRLVKSNAPGQADDATFTYDPFDRKATRNEDGKTRTMVYVASSKQLAADVSNKPKSLGAESRYYDFGANLEKYNLETIRRVKKKARKAKKSSHGWPAADDFAQTGEIEQGPFEEPIDPATSYTSDDASDREASAESDTQAPQAARFNRYQAVAEGFAPAPATGPAEAPNTTAPTATISAKKPKIIQKVTFRSLAKDVQGTVEGLEDKDGTSDADESYDLDPYGALENESQLSKEAKSNPVRFQGFTFDSAAELYDMQARHYRPEVARFMSRDRYESSALDYELESDPLTNNLYAFAGGNPVGNIEDDGHHICNEAERKTDATRKSCALHNKHMAEGKSGYHKAQGCNSQPIYCPNHLGQYPSFQQNRSAMLNSKYRIQLNKYAPMLGSPFPVSRQDQMGSASPVVVTPGGSRTRLPGWAGEAAAVFSGGIAFWEGASQGVVSRASTLGRYLNPYTTPGPAAQARAAGQLRNAGRMANSPWVKASRWGIRGVKVVPLVGAGADLASDRVIDKRSWLDATLHTGAQAAGGAVGAFGGAVVCGTETVATLGAGVVACPLIAGGAAVGLSQGAGWFYDFVAPNSR